MTRFRLHEGELATRIKQSGCSIRFGDVTVLASAVAFALAVSQVQLFGESRMGRKGRGRIQDTGTQAQTQTTVTDRINAICCQVLRRGGGGCEGAAALTQTRSVTPGCRPSKEGKGNRMRPPARGPIWLLCQTDLQVGKSVYYLVPVVGHPPVSRQHPPVAHSRYRH